MINTKTKVFLSITLGVFTALIAVELLLRFTGYQYVPIEVKMINKINYGDIDENDPLFSEDWRSFNMFADDHLVYDPELI